MTHKGGMVERLVAAAAAAADRTKDKTPASKADRQLALRADMLQLGSVFCTGAAHRAPRLRISSRRRKTRQSVS